MSVDKVLAPTRSPADGLQQPRGTGHHVVTEGRAGDDR